MHDPSPSGAANRRSPLSAEEEAAFTAARRASERFLGAARLAGLNGRGFAVFAVLSLLGGFVDPLNFAVGAGLGLVAWFELRGRDRLLALDPSGLEMLWRNQLGVLAGSVLYCLWSMFVAIRHPSPEMVEVLALLDGGEEMLRQMTMSVYGSVILVCFLYQGLSARYYLRRLAWMRAYLAETPAWIVDLQRTVHRS
jgi:hypothetical protein